MKKEKILLIISLIVIFMAFDVSAMTLKPTCPESVTVGNSFEVNITLTRSESEKKISGLDGTFSYDSSKVELTNQSLLLDKWLDFAEVSNNKQFAYANYKFDNLISETSKKIVKLTFKANTVGNVTLNINNPTATDENGKAVSVSGGSCTIEVKRQPSKVDTLSSIKIDGEEVEDFDENTTTYSINVGTKESITIAVEKTDQYSKVSGDIGGKSLKYGLNTFKITVTSEAGTKKEYVLKITRTDPRSKVNTLKSLNLSSGKITFKENITTYDVNVEKDVTKIKITSELKDSKSSYVDGYGNREVNLKEGLNTVLIKIKAENGDVRTYTLKITRETDKSIVNTLKSLTIDKIKIDFKETKYEYDLNVDKSINKIKITSELKDKKSSYVNGYGNREVDLKEGLNEVLIKVKAESGDVRTYTLNIIRGTSNTTTNTSIKEIVIKNYDINFSNNKTDYNLTIKDETKLDIEVTLQNNNATYEIINNNDLKTGSVVIIRVTAEDKVTVKDYKLNIIKEEIKEENDNKDEVEEKDSTDMIVWIICIIFFIGSLGILIKAVSSHNKNY